MAADTGSRRSQSWHLQCDQQRPGQLLNLLVRRNLSISERHHCRPGMVPGCVDSAISSETRSFVALFIGPSICAHGWSASSRQMSKLAYLGAFLFGRAISTVWYHTDCHHHLPKPKAGLASLGLNSGCAEFVTEHEATVLYIELDILDPILI